jgi:hypothetical protein
MRILPSFIVIGVQRSGTTTLYNLLAEHPSVLPALVKEVHFFDLSFQKGLNWYRGHFPLSSSHKSKPGIITGEASPYYIFHPHASRRMASLFPSMKIILLLRNPVNRAFSHYHHEVRLGFERLSFEGAIENEAARLTGEAQKIIQDENYHSFNHRHYSYLSRGYYVDQLENWMKSFPQEQVKIIKSEDFFRSPQTVLPQILKFLDLPEWNVPNFKPRNTLQYPAMSSTTRDRLTAYFEPFNRRLYDMLGADFGWNQY